MRRRTKWGIAAGLAVVVIGGATIIAATRGEKGVEVRVEHVGRRNLVAAVNASGWVQPHRKVDVQADIMGRIIDLRVEEGQAVRRGEVLLRIDPTQYEAALERARAAVSEAQARSAQASANLLQAQRQYDRTRTLASTDSSLISRQAIEETETQVKVQSELVEAARFGVAQARASLGEAQDRLAKATIRSPMDGIVTRLNVDEGETAIVGTMNNSGSLLLTVSDMATMEAVVRVDETDVPDISLGDTASIQIDAFPRQTFRGRVTEISHSSVRPPSQQTPGQSGGQAVDFEVVITFDNPPPALRPDLSATADVITNTAGNVLAIPIIALTVRDRGNTTPVPQEDPEARQAARDATAPLDVEGVFVVRNGIAHFVPVQIGIAGREHFEVVSGLSEGDSIVAGPYEAIRGLKDGDKVKRMTSPASADSGKTAGSQ